MKKTESIRRGSSRREFVKGASAIAATGALVGNLAISRTAHAAGEDTIRIALIGCGGRGTGAASQALHNKTGGVRLVAMADAFKDRLSSSLNNLKKDGGIASKIDVPEDKQFVGFDAYQKAIDSGVDMVILATPPGFRPIQFDAAVKAGKHVFMEKPVATDAPGVRMVLAAAEEAKKKNLGVGVGLQRHHDASYVETIKRIHDGEIGEVISQRVYWNGDTPWVNPREKLERDRGGKLSEMEYQLRNWYYFTWLCGDNICEQHIHNLDIANWVKQAHPVKANGMGGCEVKKASEFGQKFDHHFVEFEYADGSRMFSQCRQIPGCWHSVSEFAAGTKGTSVCANSIQLYDGTKWRSSAKSSAYQKEHDDLFASIRAGNPLNEAEYGANSTFTAILGRMATYSGKEVSWDDALKNGLSLMPKEYSFDATPPVLPNAEGFYPRAIPGKTSPFNA